MLYVLQRSVHSALDCSWSLERSPSRWTRSPIQTQKSSVEPSHERRSSRINHKRLQAARLGEGPRRVWEGHSEQTENFHTETKEMPQLAFLPDSQQSSGHRPVLRLLLPVWFPLSRIFIRSQNIHNTQKTTCKHKWAACWCMSIPEIRPAPLYPSLSWCHPCIALWPFSLSLYGVSG